VVASSFSLSSVASSSFSVSPGLSAAAGFLRRWARRLGGAGCFRVGASWRSARFVLVFPSARVAARFAASPLFGAFWRLAWSAGGSAVPAGAVSGLSVSRRGRVVVVWGSPLVWG